MPNDQPTPRPPLPPPFSRPTHPGTLPVIAPDSEAGRPLRPTPYASAVIPALAREDSLPPVAGPDAAVPFASVPAPGGPAVEPDRSAPTDEAPPVARRPADAADAAGEGSSGNASAQPAAATGPGEPGTGHGPAGQGGGPQIRSLHDLPVDHAHPTGVPPNPEPAVEGVGAAWDYPTDSVWSSDAVFGWGASVADWELVSAGAERGAGLPATDAATTNAATTNAAASDVAASDVAASDVAASDVAASDVAASAPATAGPETGTSDLAVGAAELLEALAAAVRRGDVVLPSVSWPQTAPAVLAAVLTALLARADGDEWEARVAPASGQRR